MWPWNAFQFANLNCMRKRTRKNGRKYYYRCFCDTHNKLGSKLSTANPVRIIKISREQIESCSCLASTNDNSLGFSINSCLLPTRLYIQKPQALCSPLSVNMTATHQLTRSHFAFNHKHHNTIHANQLIVRLSYTETLLICSSHKFKMLTF